MYLNNLYVLNLDVLLKFSFNLNAVYLIFAETKISLIVNSGIEIHYIATNLFPSILN